MDEKGLPLDLAPVDTRVRKHAYRSTRLIIACIIVQVVILIYRLTGTPKSITRLYNSYTGQPDFSHLAEHCAHISPVSTSSFLQRQQALAQSLHELNASAYIAEPGASAAYFANLSQSQWHLSERPLLLIISPDVDSSEQVHARVSILTPSFEATRAKLLSIPSQDEVTYPSWPEDVSPFEVAVSAVPQLKEGTIFVDGMMRSFVLDGLQKAATESNVLTAPVEIRRLRERKSAEELEIMKCVNEATLLAIRAVRENVKIGMRESEARQLMSTALSAAGLSDGSCLTLFGENAALPHGSGTDRVLGAHDFVLVDCDAELHGYRSDITRTYALPESTIHATYLRMWSLVHSAQANALAAARNGTVTAEVDAAARNTLAAQGYAQYLTHRLGHGIGLETHESPYLRGGSEDVILTGHTFSDEPGIYIEGQVGIRLEDCFYVHENGTAIFLTEGAGGAAKGPWDP
ncbi:Creatinase/aminopeptidase [Daedalea quercina L-15889]|uniref:Creatinase/aminopeptidase n=1 Tax=Daedalea quercina L-15889 TaxID=1314783 RepID=A0A165PGG5_9APHY|nr:Creatinase/aminopeptidase [Daedalea quercina L-15889]